MPREDAVQLIENDPRLNPDRVPGGIDIQDLVQILAAVNDDSRADRLTGKAGAASAGSNRDVHLGRDLNCRDQVGRASGNDDSQWLDLIDAGISAIEPARGGIEPDFGMSVGAQ